MQATTCLFFHLFSYPLTAFTPMSSRHLMNTPTCADSSTGDTNKPVDFMSELPLEIVMENLVPRILHRKDRVFNLCSRHTYISVCTTWSNRIAACAESIHFSNGDTKDFSKHAWMRVQAVAGYIKPLTIAASNPTAILNLLRYANFSSLDNLTITGKGSGVVTFIRGPFLIYHHPVEDIQWH